MGFLKAGILEGWASCRLGFLKRFFANFGDNEDSTRASKRLVVITFYWLDGFSSFWYACVENLIFYLLVKHAEVWTNGDQIMGISFFEDF